MAADSAAPEAPGSSQVARPAAAHNLVGPASEQVLLNTAAEEERPEMGYLRAADSVTADSAAGRLAAGRFAAVGLAWTCC